MPRIPEALKQFVRDNATGTYNKDLTTMVNERFGTHYKVQYIACLKSDLGVHSGIDTKFQKGRHANPTTEFKKGHTPINKGTKGMFPNAGGATRFKKGRRPPNYLPVGTVNQDVDGYWKIKIADPNTWKYKHILLWEQANGPVPKGMMVTFLDGDKNHVDLDNLALISKAANCRRNKLRLRGDTPDLGKAVVITAEIIALVTKRRKKR